KVRREIPPSASRCRTILSTTSSPLPTSSALRPSLRIEVSTGDGRPSALLPDSGDGAGVARKEVIDGLLRRTCDIAQGVYADSQSIGRASEALAGFSVEINE